MSKRVFKVEFGIGDGEGLWVNPVSKVKYDVQPLFMPVRNGSWCEVGFRTRTEADLFARLLQAAGVGKSKAGDDGLKTQKMTQKRNKVTQDGKTKKGSGIKYVSFMNPDGTPRKPKRGEIRSCVVREGKDGVEIVRDEPAPLFPDWLLDEIFGDKGA